MSDSDKTHVGSRSPGGHPPPVCDVPEPIVAASSSSPSSSTAGSSTLGASTLSRESACKTAISNPENILSEGVVPEEMVSGNNDIAAADHDAALEEDVATGGKENAAVEAPSSGQKSDQTDDFGVPLVNASDRTFIAKRVENSDVARAMVVSSPQDLGRALEGTSLDHYQLERFVGGGGMGAVFQAQDTRLGRVVAVKVLLRERADVDMVKRFQKEAQSAARLDHPNIARVYFVGENSGWNYIVFEYIEGRNLRQIVDDQGALPIEQALDYTQQIAEALQHAADREVVHRDIKPSNVLVSPIGQVKLVDMGLARLHQVAEGDEALTNTGVTLGTFDYISPEQAIEPRSADVRSDLYSLGCTLYFMLAQRPPFPDGTALQKMLRHNGDDPPDIRLFRPDIPESVALLVAKLLAKRPGDRYQTPVELIRAIQVLAQRLGLYRILRDGSGATAALSRRTPQQALSWTRFIPTVLAVGVILVGLLLWDFVSGESPQEELQLPPFPLPTAVSSAASASATEPSATGADKGKITAGPKHSANDNATAAADTNKQAKAKGAEVTPDGEQAANGDGKSPHTIREWALGPPADVSGVLAPEQIDFQLAATAASTTRVGATAASGASTPEVAVRLIRIGGPPRNTAEREADSLEQAISMSRDLTGDTIIELAHDRDEVLTSAIDLGERSIVLRGGPGSRIVFRTNTETLSSNRHALAIQNSGKLKLERLEFVLELKDRTESGWSLLRMAPGGAVRCDDCVLTMRDQTGADIDSSGSGFIAVRAPEPLTMADDPGKAAGAYSLVRPMPSAVALSNCIVRGRSTLLTMAQSSSLQLDWRGGLFASSGSLVEAGPVLNDSSTEIAAINITLERLTLVAQRGIARFKLNPKNEKGAQFAVNMQNCAVAVERAGGMEPGVALFDFSELNSIPAQGAMRDKDWLPFSYHGSWNGCEADWFLRATSARSANTSAMVLEFQINEGLPKIRDEKPFPSKVSLIRPSPGHRLCATVAGDFALEQHSTVFGQRADDLPQIAAEQTDPSPETMEGSSGAGAIMPPDMTMPDTMP